ncbi:MAG: hypothetical protein ACRDEA_19465 [Microcystaceae cyanobacterium]
MSYQIVNLTFLLVIQITEEILTDHPKYPYQIAFSIPYWRQRLIVYVLNQIPNQQAIIEITPKDCEDPDYFNWLHCPLEERIRLEKLIHLGITHILRENPNWLSCQASKEDPSIYSFGFGEPVKYD